MFFYSWIKGFSSSHMTVNILHHGIVSILNSNPSICGSSVLGSTASRKRQCLPLWKYSVLHSKIMQIAFLQRLAWCVATIVLLLSSWSICQVRMFFSFPHFIWIADLPSFAVHLSLIKIRSIKLNQGKKRSFLSNISGHILPLNHSEGNIRWFLCFIFT